MTRNWFLCLPVLVGALHAAARAEDLPDVFAPAHIQRLMVRANDWQVAHPAMKPEDRNWERSTWYTGVMAAYKATRDPRFLEQAEAWGRKHQWQVGTEKAGANRLFCVEVWSELYFETKDKRTIGPATEWLQTPASNSPAGAKVWYLEGGRRYADSLYGASALAMLAKAAGEKKYLDAMHAFWADVSDEIFDKQESLYYRDQRFIGQKSPNGKKVFWSRGNGWVLGGIVRVLEYLPDDDPSRAKYVAQFKAMAAAVARRQGADGLWRPNLDDPQHIPVPESSGSGFFCYALAWGINRGILDRPTYEPVVKKAWRGLAGVIGPEGEVQYGQPVGDRPAAVKKETTHEYVTGAFLLAGSEVLRLVKAGGMTAAATGPVAKGQRVFSTGHSFHSGFAPILDKMAKSGDFKDSTIVGVSNIGGSRVIQHWDGKGVQEALKAGGVDVLMTTPIYLPDPGVEKLAQLGFAHNPDFRLTMMEFWLPFDQYEPRNYTHGPPGSPTERLPPPNKVDHHAATGDGLRKIHERYFREMDDLVLAINKQLGKQVVFVVPVGQAVIALREKIIAGQAPGLKSQEDLFSDGLGHPKPPLTIMMGYCHYAVIYRKSPVGLPVPPALNIPGNAEDADALNRLLQKLAWEAVTRHPLSGVKVDPSSATTSKQASASIRQAAGDPMH